jgi:hypothetical protein
VLFGILDPTCELFALKYVSLVLIMERQRLSSIVVFLDTGLDFARFPFDNADYGYTAIIAFERMLQQISKDPPILKTVRIEG